MRSCDNCYWRDMRGKFCGFKENRPQENICDHHNTICTQCGENIAVFNVENKSMCEDCLKLGLKIEHYTVTHYVDSHLQSIGNEDDLISAIKEELENQSISFEMLYDK